MCFTGPSCRNGSASTPIVPRCFRVLHVICCGMAKRNLTIQLDEDVVARVKVAAARRGMSISGLVAQQIIDLVNDDARYEAAKRVALQTMAEAEGHGGVVSWRREDLYDREICREGR